VSNSVETSGAVRRTVTVAAAPERAFQVFAEQFGSWFPKEYRIGGAEPADFVVEPRQGGRWYEVGADGSECDTGRVLAYDPPNRLVLAWHLDGNFRYDPDPAHASEVEVRFTAESDGRTRVELEHRGFDRHGAGAAAVHAAVDAPAGWDYCLANYLAHVAHPDAAAG
jgi:uncharacterized protein YndB with AHSA1/START domain